MFKMAGLSNILLVICFSNAALAYDCISRTCSFGNCGEQTTCMVNGTNGCSRTVAMGGMNVVQECPSKPCIPTSLNMSGYLQTIDCCYSNECNTDSMTSTIDDPALDECFSVTCDTKGCLDKTIKAGNARLCRKEQNEKCMAVKTKSDTITEASGCQVLTEEEGSCANMATYGIPSGTNMIIQCCNTDRCNDGVFKKTPNVDNCYSITCNSTGCIDEAIQNGVYAYCPQTGHGCTTTKTDHMYISTCGSTPCMDFTLDTIAIKCCTGDLCNGPQGPESSTTGTSGTRGPENMRYVIYILMTLLLSSFI